MHACNAMQCNVCMHAMQCMHNMHTYMHACIHTYMHTYIYLKVYTYIHTHTFWSIFSTHHKHSFLRLDSFPGCPAHLMSLGEIFWLFDVIWLLHNCAISFVRSQFDRSTTEDIAQTNTTRRLLRRESSISLSRGHCRLTRWCRLLIFLSFF